MISQKGWEIRLQFGIKAAKLQCPHHALYYAVQCHPSFAHISGVIAIGNENLICEEMQLTKLSTVQVRSLDFQR